MKQKLYNLKMQILKDISIKDDLKKELAEQILQIEQELAINYTPCCTEFKTVQLEPELMNSLNKLTNSKVGDKPIKKRF